MIIAALYKFVEITDLEILQARVRSLAKQHNIFGTLLLAPEGINGTVSGTRSAIDALKNFLDTDPRFNEMEYKESMSDNNPFYRMKIKLKKEIVTFGQPNISPHKISGTYVDAKEWDELVNDPSVTVLDVRNFYEVAIGTFKNAIDPNTSTFREFSRFVKHKLNPDINQKIAMCCTGGIRCEKASSYLKSLGFKDVYHLRGGILKYLENTPKENSTWAGECFVFDHRVAVDHDLKQGSYEMCFGCRMPISAQDRLSPDFQEGVSCQRCVNQRSDRQKSAAKTRHEQVNLAKARGEKHIGPSI